jgi:DNA-binding MarR family transcriptional regulator
MATAALRSSPAPVPDADPQEGAVDLGIMAEGLGFLMKVGQLAAAERNEPHFRAAGMAPSSYTILKVLQANPGLRQGQLATALRIKPALMTKLIRGFEDAGLVQRHIPDGDRRTVELTLTAAGQARVGAADGHFDAARAAEETGMTAAEVADLRRLLRRYLGIDTDGRLRSPG